MAETAGRDAFGAALDARLAQQQASNAGGAAKWSLHQGAGAAAAAAGLGGVLVTAGAPWADAAVWPFTLVLAAVGLWRAAWSLVNAARAWRFERCQWPEQRRRAAAVWQNGWRPRHLHIQLTACFEVPEVTRRALTALLAQLRQERIPATLYLGTCTAYDEVALSGIFETAAAGMPAGMAELVFIRLNQEGHYVPMGRVLREIRRRGADPEDLILFLDDDTLVDGGLLRGMLPLFGADPGLQAAAAGEQAAFFGPRGLQLCLELCLAQRRLALLSQSASGRILTPSGRLRIFRARHVLGERFIRRLEAEQGAARGGSRFRMKSGADSVTWRHLLPLRCKMVFVPDVTVYSVELPLEGGAARLTRCMRRWTGHNLRSSRTVLALGPKVLPPFIWWSALDRRLRAAPALAAAAAVLAAAAADPGCLWFWLAAAGLLRIGQGLLLVPHARHAGILWPHALFAVQAVGLAAACAAWLTRLPRAQAGPLPPQQGGCSREIG